MIRIYNNDESEFKNNGLAVLDNAYDVHITHKINGEYSLVFRYPRDEKWRYISNERICVLGGQRFRIRTIDGDEVTATAIYNDAARKHLQYVNDMIGETPRNIMLELFSDTPVHIMTFSEVDAIGMEWVTEKTDFFEVSKITPIGGLNTLMQQMEEQRATCELYVDNYNIALVKRMGKDNASSITLRFNATKTESSRDSSQLVTRLYPYGADDLDISTVNGGKQYIDSPNIDTVGIYEGFTQFEGIEDPDELLKLARWQFDENNLSRIDIPEYNMRIDYVDVSKAYMTRGLHNVSIGDRISVFDEQMGVKTIQRVIGITSYPFEPEKSTIEVGKARADLESFFSGLRASQVQQLLQTNEHGELKTAALEMMQENKRVSINNAIRNQEIAKYKTGALFESPDGRYAVAIIDGQLAIAAGKSGGEWDWTTVIDNNQVIVSNVFTGALYTSLCEILSENGKLKIQDSLISMYDADDTLRFECGYKDGKYIFTIYDKNAEPAIHMGDDGNIIISGKISTKKNAEVGSNLKVGAGTASGRIDFGGMVNESEGSIEVVDHVMNICADIVMINGVNLETITKRIEDLESAQRKDG